MEWNGKEKKQIINQGFFEVFIFQMRNIKYKKKQKIERDA